MTHTPALLLMLLLLAAPPAPAIPPPANGPNANQTDANPTAANPTNAATQPAPRVSTRTGDLRVHDRLPSGFLGRDVRVWVLLPPGYDRHPDRRFPVFYLHDGQNLFDDATSFVGEWQADEIATALIAEGRIRPVILVGIDHAGVHRVDEYTPTRDAAHDAGGRAADHARFVVEELKPFIDRTYRTLAGREHTAVGGASLGGLVSIYLVQKHPDVFGSVMALSPSLWWDDSALLRAIQPTDPWVARTRAWIDIGDSEAPDDPAANLRNVTSIRLLQILFDRAGRAEGRDVILRVVNGGRHNELAWSDRFDDVLLFLFPPEAK